MKYKLIILFVFITILGNSQLVEIANDAISCHDTHQVKSSMSRINAFEKGKTFVNMSTAFSPINGINFGAFTSFSSALKTYAFYGGVYKTVKNEGYENSKVANYSTVNANIGYKFGNQYRNEKLVEKVKYHVLFLKAEYSVQFDWLGLSISNTLSVADIKEIDIKESAENGSLDQKFVYDASKTFLVFIPELNFKVSFLINNGNLFLGYNKNLSSKKSVILKNHVIVFGIGYQFESI